jgi:hypothetical protein
VAAVEVRDETVIVVSRRAVAAVISQRRRWRTWWPQTDATVVADRGVDGMSWSLSGAVVGVTQVALEETGDGVIVRYAMSVDPATPGSPGAARAMPQSPHGRRELDDLRRRQVVAWKRVVWALKEELEGERRTP